MTMYVRTLVPITVSVGDQDRDDDFLLDSRTPFKVLPLWVAQRESFQRLWDAGKVQVATDSAFSNIITSIPAIEIVTGGSVDAIRIASAANTPAMITSTGTGSNIQLNASSSTVDILDSAGKPGIVMYSEASAPARLVFTSEIGPYSAAYVKAIRTNGSTVANLVFFTDGVGSKIILTNRDASATSFTIQADSTSSNPNININLLPKGTGTVQVNGVPVVTTTGTQSMSNKTLVTPTITNPTITGATANTYTSTVATGTAPFTVASTTQVANLNAERVTGLTTGYGAQASSLAVRDSSANITARGFIPSFTTTATAAGTTTLSIASNPIQQFTGTTTQTVVLPTTGVVAGQHYTIINSSTGAVTVQSSALAAIGAALTTGQSAELIALVATPTTAAHWHRR
jgi:hypothetical protein